MAVELEVEDVEGWAECVVAPEECAEVAEPVEPDGLEVSENSSSAVGAAATISPFPES